VLACCPTLHKASGLKLLRRQHVTGAKGAYVFINERGQPFGHLHRIKAEVAPRSGKCLTSDITPPWGMIASLWPDDHVINYLLMGCADQLRGRVAFP